MWKAKHTTRLDRIASVICITSVPLLPPRWLEGLRRFNRSSPRRSPLYCRLGLRNGLGARTTGWGEPCVTVQEGGTLSLSVSLSLSLRFSISLYFSLCISLSLYLSLCVSLYLSLSVSLCLSLSFSLSLSLSISLSFSLSLCISLSFSLFLSLSVSFSLCLSVFLSLSCYGLLLTTQCSCAELAYQVLVFMALDASPRCQCSGY